MHIYTNRQNRCACDVVVDAESRVCAYGSVAVAVARFIGCRTFSAKRNFSSSVSCFYLFLLISFAFLITAHRRPTECVCVCVYCPSSCLAVWRSTRMHRHTHTHSHHWQLAIFHFMIYNNFGFRPREMRERERETRRWPLIVSFERNGLLALCHSICQLSVAGCLCWPFDCDYAMPTRATTFRAKCTENGDSRGKPSSIGPIGRHAKRIQTIWLHS